MWTMLWTEASFSACLAWHWPDHHWQCNWRVAWTSSCVCAGKRRTLRATIVTIFSHMIWYFSVFVKCDTIFRFFWKSPRIQTYNFRKVVRQHTEGMMGTGKCYIIYMDFVGNLLLFPTVKKFWKSVKKWQSYCHEFGVLLFWDALYSFGRIFLFLSAIFFNAVLAATCSSCYFSVYIWCLSKFCLHVLPIRF